MGHRIYPTIPTWVQTLGGSLDHRGTLLIYARCTHCKGSREIDVAALAARVGRDYSLVNRQCACRLTPGCPGMNRFHYSTGCWVYKLRDEVTDRRWSGF